jgi:hypothetical protein
MVNHIPRVLEAMSYSLVLNAQLSEMIFGVDRNTIQSHEQIRALKKLGIAVVD